MTMQYTAPEGRTVIALAATYWSKGATAQKAVANIRKEGCPRTARLVIIDAPADAWVDEMGAVCWKGQDVPRAVEVGRI